jgi:hypothetical protein
MRTLLEVEEKLSPIVFLKFNEKRRWLPFSAH